MAENRQRFSEKISQVCSTRNMHNNKFALPDSVLNPVKTETDRFGVLGGDGFVSQLHCTLVITKQGGGGLGVAKGVEDVAFGGGNTGGGI